MISYIVSLFSVSCRHSIFCVILALVQLLTWCLWAFERCCKKSGHTAFHQINLVLSIFFVHWVWLVIAISKSSFSRTWSCLSNCFWNSNFFLVDLFFWSVLSSSGLAGLSRSMYHCYIIFYRFRGYMCYIAWCCE